MPGNHQNGPLRVAIIGAGPSGFYAAEALLRSQVPVEVTVVERLPSPHGLVRSGVAPDHPKLKQAAIVFERIAQSEGFCFIGNVTVGKAITVQEILTTHHCVILAYGASEDQRIGIPGEDLAGCHAAKEFVGWYNGHPDYGDCHFDLSGETAVIIGQGNVALDVARILSKPVDELRTTDIASHAIEVLAESRIREIHVVGRRGPAQAKFTSPELREFGTIPGCDPVALESDLALNEASQAETSDRMSRTITTNLDILGGYTTRRTELAGKSCHFQFFLAPQAILGTDRVTGVRFARTTLTGPAFGQRAIVTDNEWTLPCQFILRSVGYRGAPIEGVPFDSRRGLLPNDSGRVVHEDGRPVNAVYATGWIKRGPSGIIGTNRADSAATVEALLADVDSLMNGPREGADGLWNLLTDRGVRATTLSDWRRIDAAEIERGKPLGKPRDKIACVNEMLGFCEPANG
ncbi:FAD-dependent oxidoreductase [Boseaceae bacterium BT-24-1]|nr:FAD-dependent oxidoreductase [Boseaceae bacterium BT-24-1]